MYMVLMKIYQRKCTIADPDQYIDKVKALERSDRQNELKRNATDSSMFSIYSKSQKTGVTGVGENDVSEQSLEEELETMTNTTSGVQNDPIILGLQSVFDKMAESIEDVGNSKLKSVRQQYGYKEKYINMKTGYSDEAQSEA